MNIILLRLVRVNRRLQVRNSAAAPGLRHGTVFLRSNSTRGAGDEEDDEPLASPIETETVFQFSVNVRGVPFSVKLVPFNVSHLTLAFINDINLNDLKLN